MAAKEAYMTALLQLEIDRLGPSWTDEDESKSMAEMDILYDQLTERDKTDIDISLEAPENTGMVDVAVKIGEAIPPRKKKD